MGECVVFEGSVVGPRENPSLVRIARSISAGNHEISANFDDALSARGFLREDVAKNAAFLLFVVVKAGAQFVKDATGNERCRGELRIRVRKLLA